MFEDDPTEEPLKQPKSKKLTMKELQDRVAELEVKLELAQPEHVARMQESHKQAQLRIRDLGFYLREKDYTIGRLERQVKALEQSLPPTTDKVKDMEDQLLLARKELNGARRRQENLEQMLPFYEACHTIVQEHAISLYLNAHEETTIPLQRDELTHMISFGNTKTRIFTEIVKAGEEYNTYLLTDEEYAQLAHTSYDRLLELFTHQQPMNDSPEQDHQTPASTRRCQCGCGREVRQPKTGRPGEYFSASCRKRAQRTRGQATQLELLPVTKLDRDVTKE